MKYVVKCKWDDSACVWTATSKDVPGLVLESGSLDVLMERVQMVVPDLLALNGQSLDEPYSIAMRSERVEMVAGHG